MFWGNYIIGGKPINIVCVERSLERFCGVASLQLVKSTTKSLFSLQATKTIAALYIG